MKYILNHYWAVFLFMVVVSGFVSAAEEDLNAPSCRVVPLPGHRTAFLYHGKEVAVWHYGPEYPRRQEVATAYGHDHLLETITNAVDRTDKLRSAWVPLNTPPELRNMLVEAS